MLQLLTNRRIQISLLMLLLAGLVIMDYGAPAPLLRLRELVFDTYNRSMPRPDIPPPASSPVKGVAIIDIDEDSLAKYGQWPWPRWLIARLPETLNQLGAKSIAFDMVFSEPDRTSPGRIIDNPALAKPALSSVVQELKSLPSNEDVFAKEVAAAGNVVTGFVGATQKTDKKPQVKVGFVYRTNLLPYIYKNPYFVTTMDSITEAAAGNGCFTAEPDGDGIIRRVPLLIGMSGSSSGNIFPALSIEALRVAMGIKDSPVVLGNMTFKGYMIDAIHLGGYDIPTDENGKFRVYYTGHNPSLYIPAWRLLEGKVAPEEIKDKIVFIGTSSIGLLDLRSSPIDKILPGVEIHTEIVRQILNGQFLNRPKDLDIYEPLVTVLGSLVIIFLTPVVSLGALMSGVMAFLGMAIMGSVKAYQHGILIDPVFPTLTMVTIFILSAILTNLRTEMERRMVKTAFGHYISPTLMEELTRDPDKLKLGGEVREISVMFTDIRNFTTISESMDPAELIKMMNDFLTPMTSCVLDNRGTIDKYMGDAMMAFWNAPLDDPDHALHACTAAIRMLEALKAVNTGLLEQAEKSGRPFRELRAGIGIHTGRASVGNMGSKQRFAYSALGDTVNLASRLEGQTKGYGISVMISEQVRGKVPSFAAIEIDLLTVKGRTEPERVYALLGDAAYAAMPAYQQFAVLHDKMLGAYRQQQWDIALSLADQCEALHPDLKGLYALYRQRIADFKTIPPAAGWQGVWVAKDKH